MKTIRNISAIVLAIVLGFSFTSCSSADEPAAAASEKVQEATVTYTYNIPTELLDYVMIDAVYNDYKANDVITEPVLGNTFTVTYRIDKFPTKTPVVFVYTRTNAPVNKIVDGEITMTTTVSMNVGGRTVTNANTSSISAADINALVTDVRNRTYGTLISKAGDIQFVTPDNR